MILLFYLRIFVLLPAERDGSDTGGEARIAYLGSHRPRASIERSLSDGQTGGGTLALNLIHHVTGASERIKGAYVVRP